MEKKKTAIYLRCSTKHHNQDVLNQELQLLEFAKARKFNVIKTYHDYTSGGDASREAFIEMFEDARKGKFEVVLFWALDRFSREGVLKTLNYLQELNSYNVDFVSYQEQYIDSCGIFKDAVVSILSTVAHQSKVLQGQRVKAGLEKSRKLYGRIGGQPRIPEEKRNQILELADYDYSNRQIAEIVGVSYQTVRRYRNLNYHPKKK